MQVTFPHTDVKHLDRWSNYSGTVKVEDIPLFCTPRAGTLAEQAAAVSAILAHCFANNLPIRSMGSRWSFSKIIRPDKVILDTPNLNGMVKLGEGSLTDTYKAGPGTEGRVPYWIQGGTEISAVNRRLLTNDPQHRLALQTSGAGDGHRMAGCIATATHGAALRIGALHDTVLAVHLIVAPNKAVLIQSGSAPALSPAFVDWLEKQTGLPTTAFADDDLLAAAQVSLGSLGILFSVVLETVPVYRLLRHTLPFASRTDDKLWTAIETLKSGALRPDQPEDPYHFEVLFNPYPVPGKSAAHLTLMWKTPAGDTPTATAQPVAPASSSDTIGLISDLVGALDPAIPSIALGALIQGQIDKRFATSDGTEVFPGQMFGATTLPPNRGASTEIVVDHADTRRTVAALWDEFEKQAKAGNHLLGAMALRFVPASKAHLAMNQAPMSCFIELPSIDSPGVRAVYAAVWDRLEAEKIPFTCHWGQLSGMNPARMATYFKGKEKKWVAAREKLLDATGRKVFASPLLEKLGLG